MSESVFSVCPHITGFSPITSMVTLTVGGLQLNTSETSLLIYHESAEVCYSIGDAVFHAQKGALILLPIGATVAAEVTCAGTAVLIGYRTAEPLEHPSTMLFEQIPTTAKKAILHLIGAYQSKKEGWEFSMLADLYTALYALARDTKTGNRRFLQNQMIQPSVAYLEKHLCDRHLRMREIAALSGVSEVYFRTLFVRRYGVTPVQYVNRERIRRVEQMLANGGSLSEVLPACGFSSRSVFLRTYLRTMGKAFSLEQEITKK